MDLSEIEPGQELFWLYPISSYYLPLPCTVIRLGKKKVLVETTRVTGEPTRHWVTPRRLAREKEERE